MEASLGTSFGVAILELVVAAAGDTMLESACRASFCFA